MTASTSSTFRPRRGARARSLNPVVLLGALALVGLAATACGDDDTTTQPPGGSTVTTPTTNAGSIPPPVPPDANGFSSTYVEVNGDACTSIDGSEEGQDGGARCLDVIAGYDLEIGFVGAPGTPQLTIVSKDGTYLRDLSACTFNESGDLIEVRRNSGRPFAVIVRQRCVDLASDGSLATSGEYLVIAGLAGYEDIDDKVDVNATATANEAARAIADAGFPGDQTTPVTPASALNFEDALAAAVSSRTRSEPCDGGSEATHQSTSKGEFPRVIVAIECSTGLRNQVAEIMFFDGSRLVPSGIVQYRGGELVSDPVVVGIISLDPLSVLDTSGAGSCGTLAQYGFRDGELVLRTVRERSCDLGPDEPYVEPESWPVVFTG